MIPISFMIDELEEEELAKALLDLPFFLIALEWFLNTLLTLPYDS